MGGIGGPRGVIGMAVATGVVAFPVGLTAADTIAKNWPDFDSTPARVVMVVVVWVLALLWGFNGMRPGH
jgi:hypothetical protein